MHFLAINSVDYKGGSSRRFHCFAKFLIKEGHSVKCIENNYPLKSNDVINISQTDTVFSGIIATLQRMYYAFVQRYDMLFLQKFNPLTIPCIWMAKIRGKKTIVDADDVDSFLQGSSFRYRIFSFFEDNFTYLPDLILVPNQSLYDYFRNRKAKNIKLVLQGIDLNIFHKNETQREIIRKNLGIEGKIVLTFMSYFSPGGVGNLEIILEAVKKIMLKRKDCFLLMIGGGPLLEKYKNICVKLGIKEVFFTGDLNPEVIPLYLSAADMAFICMKNDSGNQMKATMKVNEYLAMEIPVVGYLVGETKRLVGNYCLLCEPDAEFFVSKTLAFLEGKERNLQSARAFFEKNHSWEVVEELFKQALDTI